MFFPRHILRILDTQLPDALILVHENDDHYSLQPAEKMTVAGKLSDPEAGNLVC